jgi:hypothetical protein
LLFPGHFYQGTLPRAIRGKSKTKEIVKSPIDVIPTLSREIFTGKVLLGHFLPERFSRKILAGN